MKLELPRLGLVDAQARDVGRQEVVGALHPSEPHPQEARRGQGQGRLAQPRQVLQKKVSPRKDTGKKPYKNDLLTVQDEGKLPEGLRHPRVGGLKGISLIAHRKTSRKTLFTPDRKDFFQAQKAPASKISSGRRDDRQGDIPAVS